MAKILKDKGFELEDLPVMPYQADSTATAVADLKTAFNALLKKLQDAGYMAKGS
jgi:hypothetical protein